MDKRWPKYQIGIRHKDNTESQRGRVIGMIDLDSNSGFLFFFFIALQNFVGFCLTSAWIDQAFCFKNF